MEFTDLEQYKSKILNIFVLIVGIIVTINIYMNQAKIVKTLEGQKEVEIKKNEVLNRIIGLKSKYDGYKEFINSKEIATIINKINVIARDIENIDIISLKPDTAIDDPSGIYVTYPFHVMIEAKGYENAARLISELESSPDIYIVEKVFYAVDTTEEQRRDTKVKLRLNLFLKTVLIK